MPTKNELFDRATRLLKASERYERETKDPFPRMFAKKAFFNLEGDAPVLALRAIEAGETRMQHHELRELIKQIPSFSLKCSANNAANRGNWAMVEQMIIEAGLLD